jgi:hypothetical protein
MRKSVQSVIDEMTKEDHKRLRQKYYDMVTENNLLCLVLIGSLLLNVILIFK